jgi:uncharacterized protein YlxW (UPF0749 family)
MPKRKSKKSKRLQERLDDIVLQSTRSIGSPLSLLVHTCFFVGIFALLFLGFNLEQVLLLLTTAVSLEAIYLALFIQMSVNRQATMLQEVSEDVEEISQDIDEIQEEVEDLAEEVEEISEDIEEDDREDELERQADNARIEKIEMLILGLAEEMKSLKKKK